MTFGMMRAQYENEEKKKGDGKKWGSQMWVMVTIVVARGQVARSWRIVPMAAMTSNTTLQVLVLGVEGGKLDAQGINRELQGAYKGTD